MSKPRQNGNSLTGARTNTGKNPPCFCGVCDELFTLPTHIRSATRKKQYSCDVCDQLFSVNRVSTRHEWTHPARRPYSRDLRYESNGQNNNSFKNNETPRDVKTKHHNNIDEEIRTRFENLVNFILSLDNDNL